LLARSNCCQHDHSFLLKDNEDQSNLQIAGGSEQSDASNILCSICFLMCSDVKQTVFAFYATQAHVGWQVNL